MLSFRRATSTDLPFIIGLIDADSVTPSGEDVANANSAAYEDALAIVSADPNQLLLMAERNGERIGTFQLTFIPGVGRQGMWRCLVEAVHVAPEHRNKGYGRQMIAHAIEVCRDRGCGMLQLTSNKGRVDAHRFYRSLGFQQSHEGFKLYL